MNEQPPTAVQTWDLETIRQKATIDLPAAARALTIDGPEKMALANEYLKGIRIVQARIDAFCDPTIEAAWKAYKNGKAMKEALEAPVKASQDLIKGKMRAWDAEVERARREAEAKAAEDRRKAEDEAKAERERQAKAEAEALEAAARLEAEGKPEAAAKIVEAMVTAPATPPPPAAAPAFTPPPPKLEGTATVKYWKFRIVDESQIPREYMTPNEKLIGQIVRAKKDKAGIPGIEVYSETDYKGTGR